MEPSGVRARAPSGRLTGSRLTALTFAASQLVGKGAGRTLVYSPPQGLQIS